jgi:hypothetical protein
VCLHVGAQRKSTRRATTIGIRVPSVATAAGHGVRCVRVHKVDCAFSNCLPQPPRARGSTSTLDCTRQSSPAAARAGQRLAEPRRHRGGVPASRELTCEPQRLALTAANSLCVDVHHAESHGAQHPPGDVPTQGAE